MKTIRSDVLGFCSGVRLAVKSALDALDLEGAERKPKKIYSLGPLIHNQRALSDLSEKGLLILQENEIDSLDKDCAVIVRAHGVSPLVLERVKERGAKIVDATCPRVALSQRRAAELSSKGFYVILAGDKDHAEVKAVEGSALFAAEKAGVHKDLDGSGGKCPFFLVQNAEEARAFESFAQMESKTALLSQTTFSRPEFEKIAAALSSKIKGLQIFDSICPATSERQEALVDLSKKVDALVVVGGKKSANSARLFELAKSLCARSYFVESPDDLPKDFGGVNLVGLTAGASSPDFVIDQVEKKILELV